MTGLLSQCPKSLHDIARPHTANEFVTGYCATPGKLTNHPLLLLTRSKVNCFPLDPLGRKWIKSNLEQIPTTVKRVLDYIVTVSFGVNPILWLF